MPRVLYSDDHITLTLDEARGFVRYARTALPFATVDAMSGSHDRMTAGLPVLAPGLKLLVDLRQAPPRNDEAFEAVVMRLLGTFMQRFAAHAFLVKTAVGRLQTHRLARARGSEPPWVFDEEPAALRYLGIAG